MSHQSDLIATDIEAYLAQHERKELLRFLTCGSVDDGKSTLIGRLLHDSKMIYEDQLAAIESDSARLGSSGEALDLALLMDGLKAEREQGITIDVAYRYFSTARRKFIIADTPGHEQYTRNMVTGASTCDLAIILIDAQHGVLDQTRRHSFIASLLGIQHLVVAVNKMDLVDYAREAFEKIRDDYTQFAAKLLIRDTHFIPMSALKGDNVVERSAAMPWYQGSPLMDYLENVHTASDRNLIDLRFPVQWVNRPDGSFRGYTGTIASGVVRTGEEIVVLPSQKRSRVERIVTADGDLEEAFAPMAVTLTLDDEIDISRGDMLVHPGNVPRADRIIEAMIVWMDDKPLVPGTEYLIKHTTRTTPAVVSSLRYRIDIRTLHRQPAPSLALNEIGRGQLRLSQPVAADAYNRNRATGAFILIDRMTNRTVGAGMILDRQTSDASDYWDTQPASRQLTREAGLVTAEERRARYGQSAVTLLLTGLSGSGKTSIAYALERRLFDEGRAVAVLDGQNLRLGLARDLGFTAAERSENVRRAAEMAKLQNDAGLLCICALVAPSTEVRARAAEVVGVERWIEIHVDAPLEICRERSPEIYARADKGEIARFPGVSSPYEAPADPALTLRTGETTVSEAVDRIVALLREREIID